MGEPWERHLLSDQDGLYWASFQEWEAHVLREELGAGTVAWYRNPNSGRHSLQIPYNSPMGIAGLAPDFIFVNRVEGRLVASLIDPHGTYLADAVPKLRGLAEYVAKHAGKYHRVQSIAKVDGVYRMLNHLDPDVREAIMAYENPDPTELFHLHGVHY